MQIDRRLFVRGLLATPAVVAASSLMPVRSLENLYMPSLWGDGIHDDGPGLNAWFAGNKVKIKNNCIYKEGSVFRMINKIFLVSEEINMNLNFNNIPIIGEIGLVRENIIEPRNIFVDHCRFISGVNLSKVYGESILNCNLPINNTENI